MKINNKQFIKRFGSLLTNVVLSDPSDSHHVETLLRNYINQIQFRVKTRGVDETIKFFKGVHLIATKVAMGRPFDPIPFTKSKKGIPLVIMPIMSLLQGSSDQKRVGLSISKIYLGLTSQPSLDFSSITTPGVEIGNVLDNTWDDFLTKWVKKFRTPNLSWSGEWMASTKMGPNGPALAFAHHDSIALSKSATMSRNLENWLSLTDRNLLKIYKDLQTRWIPKVSGEFKHGRLGLISEGGGKTRQIAIGDYFTQNSLYSIFQWSMRCLRQLDTDGTYNQSHIVEKTRQAISECKPIHCLDLSSATDRFPVQIQENLLSKIIGIEKAQAWRALLTNRDFFHSTGNVRYAVGQPMGILSSWSIFSLTHHAIIEFCAFKEGFKTFRDYVILGDDVAIFNTKVSDRYINVMKQIGVTISQSKSLHWTPDDHFPPSAEIAKRLLFEGDEITPIPFQLASTWANDPIREAFTLRFGLKGLGLNIDPGTWETLSLHLSKRDSKKFLILTQAPEELLDSTRTLSARILSKVERGVWKDSDFSQIPAVFAEILINDLRKKSESIWEMHSELFNEEFWNKFLSRQGKPISLSVLGLGSLSLSELHPIVVVINNRLEGLWRIEELITKLKDDPENSDLVWVDVFNADFNLSRTFIREERRRSWIQARLLPKVFNLLQIKSVDRDGDKSSPSSV